jgi:hypothetical protein
MKITHTDAQEGLVILGLEDEAGTSHEIRLTSMDVANLFSNLRASLEAAIGHVEAGNFGMPEMTRVQYVQTQEAVFFRVFLTDHLFHEYQVPRNTTLATALREMVDREELRLQAKATYQQPGNPGNKH